MNKRTLFLPSSLLLLLLAALSVAQQHSQRTPPHIVLVIVDDAGIADTPFSNPHSPINTTRLTSIAKEGIVLKEYYAHPTCTPSRAALMTGRYAHNTGLPFPLLATPVAGLATDIPTLPEVLKERGYATHMVGKWHLGHSSPSFTPLHRGFDSFFGLLGGGFDHYKKSSGVCTDLWRGSRQIPSSEINTTEHATVLFTDEAVNIINNHNNNNNNKPLFLYLSYSAPHDPLQADAEYIEACKHIPHPTRRMFCAMMMQLDDNIGRRVQGALQERGMWDDTLFIFTSDNGGLPLVGGFNYPFRGTKSMAWEGGVRVPGFVKPPKSYDWPKGSEYSGLMHISDWMPTILSLVYSSSDDSDKKNDWPEKMDGVDMSTSLATNGKSARLSVVPQLDIFLNSSAYRSGCFKLLLGCPGRSELFQEPENFLLVADSLRYYSWLIDLAFNLIEKVMAPPLDQFLKYILYLQLNVWLDWVDGTSQTHMLTSYQLDSLSIVDLKERPPVIEGGNRVYLYDVCTDPSERINLASSRPEEVKRLYEEFLETFKDAPLQLAGDVVDPSAPRDGACRPWLPASSTSPATLTKNVEGSKRFFARMQIVLRVAVLVVVLLFVSVVVTVLVCCRRRQKNKQKKE